MKWMAVIIVGVLFAFSASPPLSAQSVRTGAAQEDRQSKEIVLVYIGNLGTNRDSNFRSALRNVEKSLRRQAASTGRTLLTRGISLEVTTDDGLRDLASISHFDEISVGGNWTNQLALQYLGRHIGRTTRTGIPQAILLEREVLYFNSQTRIDVGDEHEITRFVGIKAIMEWSQRGAPVP